MWTAIKERNSKEEDELVFVFVFTDGISQKVEKIFRYKAFTLERLKADIQAQLDQYAAQDSSTDKIPPDGLFDPTPPDPTPEQNARNLYAFVLNQLPKLEKAVSFGITEPTTVQELADTQKFVVDKFLPEYIDLF